MPRTLILPPPPNNWFNVRGKKPTIQNLLNSTGTGEHCMSEPLVGALHGVATIYKATGNLTASGLEYGEGIAIAPAYKAQFPYLTKIKISDLTSGRTIYTVVADTGNFGPGRKYPTETFPAGTYNRVIDLPTNLAAQLGVNQSSLVVVEKI